MQDKADYMEKRFEEEGFALSSSQKRKFYDFYELLMEKNKVMNLTGITEFHEVVEKHFLDSVSLQRVMDLSQPLRVLDLGTGAGFPGVPLKIAFPELQITLVDSLKKRVSFLEEAVCALDLENVEVIHARAEDLARDSRYREIYDLAVSRAVAHLSTLQEYCIPFLRIGGKFVSYKSKAVEEEVREAKNSCFLLGGSVSDIFKFELHGYGRSFVIVDKVKKTPKSYPRKAGLPSKEPLS